MSRALSQKEQDIQMMLAADVHLGTKNCDFQMERYVFKRRSDGQPPHSSAPAPGTFTNQLQTSFSEPHLLILTDPRTDHQSIKESALGNIPTIAFCDTDSPMRYVDIGITANNKGKHSIGRLFWLLARMVLQMRGTIAPGRKWEVMVDLFFYRVPEEAKEQEEADVAVAPEYGDVADYTGVATDQWPTDNWGDNVGTGAPVSSAGAVEWAAALVSAVSDGGWDPAAAPPVESVAPAGITPSIAPSGWEGWD